jgi:hypothetical protein
LNVFVPIAVKAGAFEVTFSLEITNCSCEVSAFILLISLSKVAIVFPFATVFPTSKLAFCKTPSV